jgi:hypothetical protein
MKAFTEIKDSLSKIIVNLSIGDQFRNFSILVGAFVFLIALIRSVTVGLTYDEADTYSSYTKYWNGFLTINIANNHPLNSFLIYLTTKLTGISFNEFILRLPNVIAFFVYLLLAYKIASGQKYRYFTFSILVLNPYLNEFFGLARGYGIAAMFTLAALMFYSENPKNYRKIIIALYLLTLSTTSILSGLVLFASFLTFVTIFNIGIKNLPQFLRGNFIHIIFLFAINAYLAYVFLTVTKNDPNLAGDYSGNLFKAIPMIYASMLITSATGKLILAVGGILFFLVGIATHLKKLSAVPFSTILVLDILITFAASMISHKPLPTGRVLLPMYPLLGLAVGELITKMREFTSSRYIPVLISATLGIACLLLFRNYINRVNFIYMSDLPDNYRIPLLVYKAMVEQKEMPNVGNPAEDFYISQINERIHMADIYLRDHNP